VGICFPTPVVHPQQYESKFTAATQAHGDAVARLEDQVAKLQEQLKLSSSEATVGCLFCCCLKRVVLQRGSVPCSGLQMNQANHQKALEEMRAAHEREMKSLSVVMADKIQAVEDAGRQVRRLRVVTVVPFATVRIAVVVQDMERQRKAMDAQKQQELHDAQKQHEENVRTWKSQHEATLKHLQDEHVAAVTQARQDAEMDKANALKHQLEKLTSDHESMVAVLYSRHKGEVERWEHKLDEVKLALKSALDRGDGLAEQLTRTKEQFASAIEQAAADLRLTISRHEV
jgi:hypothetical protein